jgi:hypothetical protein
MERGDHKEDSPAGAVLLPNGEQRAREMYRRFLESEYPDALAMAEDVLRDQPDDVMALAIVGECRAALAKPRVRLSPSVVPTIPAPASSIPPRDSELPTSFRLPDEEATPPYALVTHTETSHMMCERFLESDHPAALALAEAVLEENPGDRIARAIAEQCRAALEESDKTAIDPSPRSGP